ncbi:MAG: hypothetical protein COA79_08295 [Planctomycetota bacterium]|nr:MAG: hypothetical protein COA79_08295 [Planctomycetota bacterium]
MKDIEESLKPKFNVVKWFAATPMFSPAGLIICALFIAGFYGLLNLFGLRVYTGILSGTFPVPATGKQLSAFYGFFYLISYFGFVFISPVLIITATIQTILYSILKISIKKI